MKNPHCFSSKFSLMPARLVFRGMSKRPGSGREVQDEFDELKKLEGDAANALLKRPKRKERTKREKEKIRRAIRKMPPGRVTGSVPKTEDVDFDKRAATSVMQKEVMAKAVRAARASRLQVKKSVKGIDIRPTGFRSSGKKYEAYVILTPKQKKDIIESVVK